MQSKIRFFFFTFFVMLFSCSEDTVTNPNVYDFNGGFETSVNNFNEISGWYPTILTDTEDFVKFGWNSEEKHSGNYSVSIKIEENHPTDKTIAYNWTKIYKPFVIGSEYEIKGWVKTYNLNESAFLLVQCWDKNHEMVGIFSTFYDYQIVGTNDWNEVKTTFIPPENTHDISIRIGITAPLNNGGKVWFDDISIMNMR